MTYQDALTDDMDSTGPGKENGGSPSVTREDHVRSYSSIKEPEKEKASSDGMMVHANGYKEEFKIMLKLAFPIVLTTLFQNLQGTIAVIFCGHLGSKVELDGAALAVSMINVTCIAVGSGMGTACDTFFSQTFGSANKKKVGIYLQRAFIIFSLVLMVVFTIHLNLATLLRVLGQEPEVAKLAGDYVLIFMPGGLFYFAYVILSKYVLNQGRTIPMVLVGFCTSLVNVALHYVFIFHADLGIMGSSIAQSCAYFTSFILTFLFIYCSRMYTTTWDGWSMDALQEWGTFSRLAMAGMIMVCVEWWAFEIGVFLSGILGQTELGAQSVVMQLDNIYFQLPLGTQTATCIRTGLYLGAGSAIGARRTARVAICIVGVVSLIVAVLFVALRHELPWLFTNVEDVVSLTSALLPLVSLYAFFDSIACVCKGVLHGSGRQIYGAIILIIFYYFIVFPIAAPLMFLTPLRSYGYWFSMAGSLIVQCGILLGMVLKTNWQKQVEKAKNRTSMVDNAEFLQDVPDENTALLPKQGDKNNRYNRKRSTLSASLSASEVRALTQEMEKLPVRALVTRRLVTVGAFVCFLAAGILVKIFVRLPEHVNVEPMSPMNNGTNLTSSSYDAITTHIPADIASLTTKIGQFPDVVTNTIGPSAKSILSDVTRNISTVGDYVLNTTTSVKQLITEVPKNFSSSGFTKKP